MRQNQKNNRMRNRPRKGGGGNGGNPGNNLNRSYESNGPDVKVRGTPHHIAEKYQQLARDATSAGDRVAAENYYQHAEHYLRIIAAAQAQQAEFQERRRIEDERRREEDERWREEQERRRMERQERQGGGQGNGQGGERQDRQGNEHQGGDRYNGERQNGERQDRFQDRAAGDQPRGERFEAREDGRQDGRQGAQNGDQPYRGDGSRGQDREQDDRPRRRRRNGSANEQVGDAQPDGAMTSGAMTSGGLASTGQPAGMDGAQDAPRANGADGDVPAPRRRRGRKPAETSQDGGDMPDGQAIAHALPGGSLDASASGGADAAPDDAGKPKRRRAPARRKADGPEAPEFSAEDA